MKNYILYIKNYPYGIIVGTIINLMCLIGDGYHKVFNNNIFNFLIAEITILLIYFIVYTTIKNLNKWKTID